MEQVRPIKPSERDRYIAYVGMYADTNAAIWGQYDRMVDFVFEHYPSTGNRFDPIAVPLLNTIAHGIELGLKENIIFFHSYHKGDRLKNFESWVELEKSHDLDFLADEFKIGYFRFFKKVGLSEADREEFNKYFFPLQELLDVLNRSSETFRYATKINKHGEFVKMSVDRKKTFDLLKIKELFHNCKTLLIGAPNSVAHYTDFMDYQLGNPEYDAGKGYLYCQRLPYSDHFFKEVEELLNERMTQIGVGLWFDIESSENYEIQIWENDIYIICVDPAKVFRRGISKTPIRGKDNKSN